MAYVDPKIKDKFESLSIDLKNALLERNVQLHTMSDLMQALDDFIADEEKKG